MSGPEVLTRDDDIDVVGVFAALKRKWWLIALVTVLTGVGLFFLLSSLDPKYGSNARILIKDGNTAFTRATSDANSQSSQRQLDEQAVRSEVEIANSNNLALEVIDEMGLVDNAEFTGEGKEPGFLDLVFAMLGQSSKSASDIRNQVLKKFKERLTVYAVEQSRVIVIEFWAHDPELAQKIVSALSEKYIGFKRDARLTSQQSATEWLDPRITELETAVSEKEAAVANFRASEDLLRSNDNDALLATQQLSQISTELSRLKAQRSSAQAKVAAIRSALQNGSSLDVIPDVVESNLVQRLREREVALRSQISDLSVTLLPNHPRMKSLNSQLANLQRQIRGAAENVVNSLEGNVASIREAEADLAKEIIRLKSEAARVDEKLVELRAREREAETARNLLAEYKSRSLEAKSRAGLSQTDAEIISPASMAIEPYFPKVGPFTAAGAVAAMILTALCVIAGSLLTAAGAQPVSNFDNNSREEPEIPELLSEDGGAEAEFESELTDSVIEQKPVAPPQEVAEATSPEITVAMPAAAKVAGMSKNSAALAIRYAAAALADLEGARIVTCCPEGHVSSSTSWILARHLAAKDRSVIVIEFNEDNSISAEMLGTANYPGFFNLITGSVTADRAIFKDMHSDAHVMPAGSLFSGQPLPEAEIISDLVDAIAQSYDFCILDCGDAAISDMNVVATEGTVAIVSCIDANPVDCNILENALKADGYEDVLQINPDEQDQLIAEAAVT
ncbi:MAG: exopolysaccharide transport family protein [Pseudomonadota bacterium]